MNVQEYIASGILEQYALGLLSAAEAAQVEQYAAEYPEIRVELERIRQALESYATAHAVKPDDGFKARVMSAIGEPPQTGPPRTNMWLWILGLLVAACLVGLFLLRNQIRTTQNELQSLQATYDQLRLDCVADSARLAEVETHLRHLRDAGTRTVNLAGTNLSPASRVNIFWNPDQQATYMDVVDLPTVPSGSQYQLWALVNGTPVDMGVITLDLSQDTLIQVPHIADAGGFAITLEPAGGSVNPTLDQMYVIGTI